MTRLFNRKKNNKTTIAELEEYYANQNQKKSSTWRAWLMAIVSVLITVLVIVLLFLAGRWLYQEITDSSSDDSTTSESDSPNEINVILPTFDGDTVGRGNGSGDSDSTNNTDDSSVVSGDNGTVSDQAASTSESNADRLASSNNSSGSTDGSSVAVGGEVPNTGAGEILVLAPMISGVLGYFVYRKKQIKNYN
jgi:cytoskeletal protein RodZ